jgi:hypothetical protein
VDKGDRLSRRGNVGLFEIDFSSAEIASIRARFRRDPLYKGPCLIIERQAGLALDVTYEPTAGTRPVLYTVHGLPWQRWNIRPAGQGTVTITAEHGGLALAAPRAPDDWSPLTLERTASEPHQRWRLRQTDDGSAFLIESAVSAHAIDATQEPTNLSSPHLWSSHWAAWQQWVICRLPID